MRKKSLPKAQLRYHPDICPINYEIDKLKTDVRYEENKNNKLQAKHEAATQKIDDLFHKQNPSRSRLDSHLSNIMFTFATGAVGWKSSHPRISILCSPEDHQ